MNRLLVVALGIVMIFGLLGMSWQLSAAIARTPELYRLQQTPTPTSTPTPVPTPSPSPGVTPTPVPEPEPAPSPSPTPFSYLRFAKNKNAER